MKSNVVEVQKEALDPTFRHFAVAAGVVVVYDWSEWDVVL
jgi:hypothetical protein